MDPLSRLVVEQRAYERQERMRDEARRDYLVRGSNHPHLGRKLAIVLVSALLAAILIVQFVSHVAAAAGGGGGGHIFLMY